MEVFYSARQGSRTKGMCPRYTQRMDDYSSAQVLTNIYIFIVTVVD